MAFDFVFVFVFVSGLVSRITEQYTVQWSTVLCRTVTLPYQFQVEYRSEPVSALQCSAAALSTSVH